MFVSFTPSTKGIGAPAWIDGWRWHQNSWQLRTVVRAGGKWSHSLVEPTQCHRSRAFEPSTPGIKILGTENVPFDIPDLSSLAPLLEPREVLGPMLSGAARSGHAIYAAETESGKLLLPAWLLMDILWGWSSSSLKALLTPNSLDVLLTVSEGENGSVEATADPILSSQPPSQIALQRIAWLATASDARKSWASVLTNAYTGRVDLLLPKARLRGWLWGARVRAGLVACELASTQVDEVDLKDVSVCVGSKTYSVIRHVW